MSELYNIKNSQSLHLAEDGQLKQCSASQLYKYRNYLEHLCVAFGLSSIALQPRQKQCQRDLAQHKDTRCRMDDQVVIDSWHSDEAR